MKQKDLVAIIAAVIVSGIFSFLICSKFIATPTAKQEKAEVVEPISQEFNVPDKTVFNTDAINPTELIQIGPNANDQPFADK